MRIVLWCLLVLSTLLCTAYGWETGTQYVYNYRGRSLAGIRQLKQQNAGIELQSRVVVQCINESTVVIKLTDSRIMRNVNHLENSSFTGDTIVGSNFVEAPFVVTCNKGSITGIKTGAEEPLWVVNYKKSIASQLQLDITGVRGDDPGVNQEFFTGNGEGSAFSIIEDSVTGNCSTIVAVSRLSTSQIYNTEAFKLKSFNVTCQNEPMYQVVKTKDFDNCKTDSNLKLATFDNVHNCDYSKANCGELIKRTSVFRYTACGESLSKLTVVHVSGVSDLLIQPFASKKEALFNSVIVDWSLEEKGNVVVPFSTLTLLKEHQSLSFDFKEQNETPDMPDLQNAFVKSSIPVSVLHNNILNDLRIVARDLKKQPDAEKDKLEHLAAIGRVLPLFSLDELKLLWQDIKNQNNFSVALFVDCVVQCGSNPAVMLIKELIQSKQIDGHMATWALAAIGHYIKTPTHGLLQELVNLLKTSSVQSFKPTMQSGLMAVANLLNIAYSSRLSGLINHKENLIINEFLPLLVRELESSQCTVDRVVSLTVFSSLGVEEIVPILLPIIRGNGKYDDTAERVRAILSLQRVVLVIPEKIYPILISLATNIAERPEVRMASLGVLLMSNAPLSLWQKIASSTWFEPSKQVTTFIYTLLRSIAETSNTFLETSKKARTVWDLVKPASLSFPYSFSNVRSSHLNEVISIMMHSDDQQLPVYLANYFHYQFGSSIRQPISVTLWNYNMDDVTQNIFGKLFGRLTRKYDSMWTEKRSVEKKGTIKGIWDELNITPRSTDKRAGLLHISLLGSIHRFINLEKLYELFPGFFPMFMKSQVKPFEFTKYHILAEKNIRFVTELGLPTRYYFTSSMLASTYGQIKGDNRNGIASELNAEIGWKMTGEIRFEIPFNGNYIATGFDVRLDARSPKKFNINYKSGHLKLAWTPGNKVADLIYYHVKPYTTTHRLTDTVIGDIIKDPFVHIINDKPMERKLSLSDYLGVNLKLTEQRETTDSKKWSWYQELTKWNIKSLSDFDFVPLELNNRKYVLSYEPSGTRSRTVSIFFQYQYATKTSQNTIIYESGSSQSRTSSGLVSSWNPISAEFQPVLGRLFKKIKSGNAQLLRGGMAAEWKNGTFVHFNITAGLVKDAWDTKDFTDLMIEKYTLFGPNAQAIRKTDYNVCYTAVRNWNKPSAYGFSKDVLYMTEEDHIAYGEQCDQNKIRIKAKVYRDDYAAKAAMYSTAGKQCQRDMASGFMYGSPACTEARQQDQTYNNYELAAEAESLPESVSYWVNSFRQWFNHKLYPFTVKLTQGESNAPNRVSWTIKRDPWTGASNLTFVRPMETLVAHNVHWGFAEWSRFSPLSYAYAHIFYPLNAGSNFFRNVVNIITPSVSESRCYVGPDAVYTFDGAFYNYTVNECPHVLMTDCHKKSEIVVSAYQGPDGQKTVIVLYGKDTVELNAVGYVTINGMKTSYQTMSNESRIEIYESDRKTVKAVVYSVAGESVRMDIIGLKFVIKVHGSQVQLSAPVHLRGKTCGMCGDFNQEISHEWKTPERCAVSSGKLMATSFRLLTSGEGCSATGEISRRLKVETETCASIDQQYRTFLPDYVL